MTADRRRSHPVAAAYLGRRPVRPVEKPEKLARSRGQGCENRFHQKTSVDIVCGGTILVAGRDQELWPPTCPIDRQVVRHGVDPPRSDGGPGVLSAVLPKAPECLLHDVFRGAAVPGVTVGEPQEASAMSGHPFAKPFFVRRAAPSLYRIQRLVAANRSPAKI